MKIRLFACIVAFIIVPFSVQLYAAEKPVTPVPVAKEMLDGTRLVLKAAGASVDLPGPGWSWMTFDKAGQNYLCLNSKTFEMILVGLGELKHEMVDHQPQSLIASAKKTQESRGGKVEDDKYEFIVTPGTTKSAKITFTEADKTKKTYVRVNLYQVPNFMLVKVQCSTPTEPEPEAFKAIVKSLKFE
jgi:hypothetical protein